MNELTAFVAEALDDVVSRLADPDANAAHDGEPADDGTEAPT